MKNYGPTTTPGEIRHRARYIGIRVPLDERTDAEKTSGTPAAPVPTIEYLEQSAVRLADGLGERRLDDLGGSSVQFDPAEMIPLRHPVTDEPTGTEFAAGQAMAMVYSYIRHHQERANRTATEGITP